MINEENKIQFDLNGGLILALQHIANTISVTNLLYNSVNGFQFENFNPLPTNSLPIFIGDGQLPFTVSELKRQSIEYVIFKCVEDVINGLTKGFKQDLKMLKFANYIKDGKLQLDQISFDKKQSLFEKETEKQHFPILLKSFENLLAQPLLLKKEILSLNSVRNCIVHRHGIVHELDVTQKEHNTLDFHLLRMQNTALVDGKEVKLDYEIRKKQIHAQALTFSSKSMSKSFKIGQKIDLDIDDLNDIFHTCIWFYQHLSMQIEGHMIKL